MTFPHPSLLVVMFLFNPSLLLVCLFGFEWAICRKTYVKRFLHSVVVSGNSKIDQPPLNQKPELLILGCPRLTRCRLLYIRVYLLCSSFFLIIFLFFLSFTSRYNKMYIKSCPDDISSILEHREHGRHFSYWIIIWPVKMLHNNH